MNVPDITPHQQDIQVKEMLMKQEKDELAKEQEAFSEVIKSSRKSLIERD